MKKKTRNKKRTRKIFAIGLCMIMAISINMIGIAGTQYCNKSGGGYKYYNSGCLKTGWSGTLTGVSNNIFNDDKCIFKGNSYSMWTGNKPFYADKIIHYDIIEVKGIGSVSFSGGVGASSSGASASFGIGGTSSSKNKAYAYEISKGWRVGVSYSYYAEIYDWSWMDLYTAATFKFGNDFKVVNSRNDNPYVNTGKIRFK